MCPRAHGGAAMVRARASSAASAHSFAEEEYIDLDLSSCGEYQFRVCRSKPAAPCPCPDELVRRARQHKVAPRPGGKLLDADAGAAGGCGRRGTATVAPLQHSSHAPPHAGRRRKPGKAMQARLQASRAFLRSLFARTWCSDERCRGVRSGSRATHDRDKGVGVSGKSAFGQINKSYVSGSAAPTTLRSSIEREKLMEEEEHVRQRKSFSGVIKWRPTTAASSARRNSCGSAPALKRSSSCRSESEGLIQGAIAYCKRSQQQRVLLARKSVSDAALCSFRAPS
ncbi:hypothetical protein CFC21_062065 [Triticum aestivum]|uniref:DUF4005 domain-containing protein n=3 Tax=Triticinae TaxID=1648030 RepID=A0A9R1KHK3_WHEAT|nr:LOW QUALITY PROTEIN: probable membrane-associated kinase regulator 4 [Aegilops tauschii subsp. strangulata]XP_044377952.1 probable membrane-associated kinase regulator 4 [Triticum aestivum]KAF7054386.1 hypothetical protein CFC21_062065 [Triticum aestivum]